ncbi:hypothetical protein IW261DRAFT_1660674, partial [Armillaria novae-zelandiae]
NSCFLQFCLYCTRTLLIESKCLAQIRTITIELHSLSLVPSSSIIVYTMSGTCSKTSSTLMDARKANLDRFYEDSPRIDDQTKTNNHSLLGIIRLFLDNKANEVTKDPKFDPFLQFIKQILVHLLSSSDQPLAGTAVIFATLVQDLANLTQAGRRAWRESHPHHPLGDSMEAYIVSYIRHSPLAIVLVDTKGQEEPCRATKAYSRGFVCKGADENNEMFFSGNSLHRASGESQGLQSPLRSCLPL